MSKIHSSESPTAVTPSGTKATVAIDAEDDGTIRESIETDFRIDMGMLVRKQQYQQGKAIILDFSRAQKRKSGIKINMRALVRKAWKTGIKIDLGPVCLGGLLGRGIRDAGIGSGSRVLRLGRGGSKTEKGRVDVVLSWSRSRVEHKLGQIQTRYTDNAARRQRQHSDDKRQRMSDWVIMR